MSPLLFAVLVLAQQPPLESHTVKDTFGRQISFQIEPAVPGHPALPIALFILGSGAHSNFLIRDGATLTAHRDFRDLIKGRARLLVVEKPGVPFASHPSSPGTAQGATEEFRREHTFPRWLEALSAALIAARKLPGFDLNRTLVVGHSEGSLMAAALAARHNFITGVACLAVIGPSQLDDLLYAARLQKSGIESLKNRWRDIRLNSADHNRMWLGHAYPYWASFMTVSEAEQLTQTRARILIAKGGLDGNKPQQDLDFIEAKLLGQGREITSLLIEDSDHGFHHRGGHSKDGWRDILSKVAAWFFNEP